MLNDELQPTDADRAAVHEGLAAVERRIDRACERAGRERTEVRLVPVTKTVSPARIGCAIEAGYREFAENRVQEAEAKAAALADWKLRWHLVGPLQRNKVKQALGFVHCIQTIERANVAERIADQLAASAARRAVLLQVNTSGAASQHGVAPDAVDALATAVIARPELDWMGLMTIGRLSDDPEHTRDCFRLLRQLRDRLQDDHGIALPELSMGMSGDLEVAVEEGATLVRVGSAIFGARQPVNRRT